jgi:hypothetical protein
MIVNNNKKVIDYTNDIVKKINDDEVGNIIVVLVREDKDTVFQIASNLYSIGYKVSINKYHDSGYELGVFLW